MADVAAERPATTYDGVDARALATALGLPRVLLYESIASTMDAAHALGAGGAPAGTLVLADEQTAGRGRAGRHWHSAAGRGIWLTLLERPDDARALDVLSLRLGVRAAAALDRFSRSAVRLKWPNDLYAGEGKLGGVLVEARWHGSSVDWVAIGFGLNVGVPDELPGASLRTDSRRADVLADLVPALRAAAAARGLLTEWELAQYAARDLAQGRACVAPVAGTVRGITESGALRVETADGERAIREGSLVFREDS